MVKEGMLALIREENLSPNSWPMGRIDKMHPGADGIVRVVTLKTAKGEVKRAVLKLSILPMDVEAESSTAGLCSRV